MQVSVPLWSTLSDLPPFLIGLNYFGEIKMIFALNQFLTTSIEKKIQKKMYFTFFKKFPLLYIYIYIERKQKNRIIQIGEFIVI